MTAGTHIPSSWWGDFNFQQKQSKQWRICLLNLIDRRLNDERQTGHDSSETRSPMRHLGIIVGIAYNEGLKKLKDALDKVANNNPLCLEKPKTLYVFQRFGESSLNVQYSTWAKRDHYINLKNYINDKIKNSFNAHGIESPFPHRSTYAGSVITAFLTESTNKKQSA